MPFRNGLATANAQSIPLWVWTGQFRHGVWPEFRNGPGQRHNCIRFFTLQRHRSPDLLYFKGKKKFICTTGARQYPKERKQTNKPTIRQSLSILSTLVLLHIGGRHVAKQNNELFIFSRGSECYYYLQLRMHNDCRSLLSLGWVSKTRSRSSHVSIYLSIYIRLGQLRQSDEHHIVYHSVFLREIWMIFIVLQKGA